MVTADDIAKKEGVNLDVLLEFSPEEHPVALQLGGADSEMLAQVTSTVVREAAYDEINLNCGCPSHAVTCNERKFGARCMHDPELVRRCVTAMSRASNGVPISVKCRLGTNEVNGYENLAAFVSAVSNNSGVQHFLIHSRLKSQVVLHSSLSPSTPINTHVPVDRRLARTGTFDRPPFELKHGPQMSPSPRSKS